MLGIKKSSEEAKLPSRATEDSAGLDLKTVDKTLIKPLESRIIDTHIALELPSCASGLIMSKSGPAMQKGLVTVAGLLDPGFRGTVAVQLYNIGKEAIEVDAGEEVAQLLILPFIKLTPVEVDHLPPSYRGDRGCGKPATTDKLTISVGPYQKVKEEDQESEVSSEHSSL